MEKPLPIDDCVLKRKLASTLLLHRTAPSNASLWQENTFLKGFGVGYWMGQLRRQPLVEGESMDMKSQVTYEGQCASCVEAEHCTFPRVPGRPIRNCEEFRLLQAECTESNPTRCSPKLVPEEAISAARAFKGLCSICDHYETCTFPRTEGVPVTCCEEYC
jgi:hypothetical protein